MNLISVIIPVYNIAPYLPVCLDSVLAQTYRNLEIILVDDGSTDGSGSICDNYAKKDLRIKVIHKTNGGVSAARNDGMKIASGNYIGFVDGDDPIEKDMYEILARNAVEQDADISICKMDTIDVDGKPQTSYDYATELISAKTIVKGYFFNPAIKAIMYSQCNKLFKKEILEDLFFKDYRYCEDILFVFEAVLKSDRIYYDNRIGYHYVHRNNSAMTSEFSEKRLDYIYAAQELVCKCAEKYPEYADEAERWLYLHTLVMLRQIIVAKKQQKFAQFFEEGKKYIRTNKHHLGKLGFKRKLDYFGVVYCNTYLKLIGAVKEKIK